MSHNTASHFNNVENFLSEQSDELVNLVLGGRDATCPIMPGTAPGGVEADPMKFTPVSPRQGPPMNIFFVSFVEGGELVPLPLLFSVIRY